MRMDKRKHPVPSKQAVTSSRPELLRFFFNEINAFPGMTETSLYPRLTEDMGFAKGEFINLIIESVCKDDRDI